MKAETTTRVKDTLSTGRHTAAGVLDRAGGIIRDRSQQAARLVERGGSKAASAVESSAERVDPERNRVRTYVSTHPRRFFAAAALLTVLLTLLLIRARSGGDNDLDDDDF